MSISTNWRLGFPLNPRPLLNEDSLRNSKKKTFKNSTWQLWICLARSHISSSACFEGWRLATLLSDPFKSLKGKTWSQIKSNATHRDRATILTDQYTVLTGENECKRGLGVKVWAGSQKQSWAAGFIVGRANSFGVWFGVFHVFFPPNSACFEFVWTNTKYLGIKATLVQNPERNL